MSWQKSKLFKQEYYIEGMWRLDVAYKFPHCKYLGADTETKLYYNDKLLSEDEAYNLYKRHGQKWCKENIEVRAYAFMLSDGENFALFQNCQDFLTACAMFNVNTVFWYNAKFDFSIFDYYMLTHNFKDVTEELAGKTKYGKLPSHTYQSLNGEFGQRYSMTIWQDYINRQNQKKVHKFRMIDICNIFGGGLAKNLEDWKIKDHQGNDVRKLEMDYVNADIESDIQYMVNDTKGLMLLAEEIEKTMKKITGFSLFDGDFMTAGGLAKKTLLNIMFHQHTAKDNIKAFKLCFPLKAEEDTDYRTKHLYLGGKCFVNPLKVGVVQSHIYKYDVNSMYPNQMKNMKYPFGVPKKVHNLKKIDNNHVYIVKIKDLFGTLKHNMIPIWQDALTGDYVEVIREQEERYIWLEELKEIGKWYDLEYKIVEVLEFQGKSPKGAKTYVDKFYTIKGSSKGAIKQGAKLLLNSAYGKLAQKIERELCVYELDKESGCVHLVKKGKELDEKGMLSVVVGSRITALARVHLCTLIRLSSKGNVRKNFCYCDTDSVHSLCEFTDPAYVDDKELGKLKCEGIYEHALYLAPKTYLLYNREEGYEVHCKGVNTKVVKKEIGNKSFEEACDIFKPNRLFRCLCGLNVKGGKALIYVDKMILNDENLEIVKKDLEGLEEIYEDDIDNMELLDI